jgi:hypothetical protein
VADIQTGWGPFVATYLTSAGWLQFDIGLILTIGTVAGFVLQVPMGAVMDAEPAKRLVATSRSAVRRNQSTYDSTCSAWEVHHVTLLTV